MAKPKPMDALRTLPEKLDLIGFATFTPSIIMLLLAVQWGGNGYAWSSPVIIGLFVGAGVNGLLWLVWDWYKKDAALIPLPMLKQRIVWSSCLTAACLLSAMICTSYYLPIYFQGVKGTSPTLSGVYLLPGVITQLVVAVGGGQLAGKVGYYLPFSLASGVFTAIGYGLLSTLTPHTSTGKWVGYQILFGVGRGAGIQMPYIAVQNTLSPPQIPVSMALLNFTSTLSAALCLAFSDTIFTNSLQTLIPRFSPNVDVAAVIAKGATAFRSIVSDPASFEGVLMAYAQSIDRVFYMLAALAVCSFFTAFGMGWKDIREKALPVSKA